MRKNNRIIFIVLCLALLSSVTALAILIPKSFKAESSINEQSIIEEQTSANKKKTIEVQTTADEQSSVSVNQRIPKTSANVTKEKHSADNTSSPKKSKGQVKKLEMPATQKGEIIVSHMAYTLSFNKQHNNPNWVAWDLTKTEVEGTGRRANDFLPDPMIEKRHQVTTKDYTGSGYDRGHMCPAADNKWNPTAMTECFYMSNMCPQLHELNAGSWESLESACRRWAKQEGCIYIICGPVYDSNRKNKAIGKEHKVTVPTGFFKCVLSTQPGKEKAIGFYFANNDKKQKINDLAVPVDEIEAMTGYDFFCNLDKKLEKKVEAQCNIKAWR